MKTKNQKTRCTVLGEFRPKAVACWFGPAANPAQPALIGARRKCTETDRHDRCAGGGDVHGATLAGEEPWLARHEHRGGRVSCRAWHRGRKLAGMTGATVRADDG
jgi:hypothetical protein